ncbi:MULTISPECIES: MFS transporter [Chitinophagaceae]
MPLLQDYKKAFKGISRENWLLSIVLMINRCGYMAVPFVGLYVTEYMHRPKQDAGLIITLFGIGSIFGSMLGGKLTDRFGFRKVQVGSAISGGLLFFVFGAIQHFQTLCVMAVVLSFFTDAFGPANFTAIASYATKDTITRAYTLNRLAINLGWTLGISLGGMIAAINYHLLFIFQGSVNIACGLLIFFLLPKKDNAKKEKSAEAIKNNTALKPWQDRTFMFFIATCALMTVCFFQMFRVVPIFYKEEWKMNEFLIGLIMGANGLLIVIFEMLLIAKIEHRHSPIYFVIIGVFLLAVAYYLLALPPAFPITIALASMVFFTFGEMLTTPFINTLVVQRSNPENRGVYAASYNMCWSFSQVVGPSGGLYIAGRWGYTPLWLFLGSLLLLCTLFYYKMRNTIVR